MSNDVEVSWENLNKLEEVANQEIDLGFSVYYAGWVEYGTKPHRINKEGEQRIREWVRRKAYAKVKLGPKYYTPGRKAKLKYTNEDEEKIEEMAQAIIWSIRKHGTKPHPYLRPALDRAERNFIKILEENWDLMDVAEFIISDAQQNISKNGIDDKGHLLQSAFKRRIR